MNQIDVDRPGVGHDGDLDHHPAGATAVRQQVDPGEATGLRVAGEHHGHAGPGRRAHLVGGDRGHRHEHQRGAGRHRLAHQAGIGEPDAHRAAADRGGHLSAHRRPVRRPAVEQEHVTRVAEQQGPTGEIDRK